MKKLTIIIVLILFSQFLFAQVRKVSGVVKDSSNLPLPGVTILIEGTKNYNQTDFEGNYTIKVKSDQFLIFSYVGTNSQRIKANSDKINVTLLKSHAILPESYGPPMYNKKKSFLNAIKKVDSTEIKN